MSDHPTSNPTGNATETTQEPELSAGDAFLLRAFEPANREQPYPLYAEMRAEGAALEAGNNLWLTFDYASAHQLLRARDVSSDERRGTFFRATVDHDPKLQAFRDKEPLMLFMDPPDHTRLRSLVGKAFTPRTVERAVPRITELTTQLLDDVAEQGAGGASVDLVDTLAYPLPVAIICELMGIPGSDEAIFRDWSQVFTKSIDPSVLRSAEEEAAIEVADAELSEYIGQLLKQRADNPTDDLLSSLVAARDGDDRLTEGELVNMVKLLLVAGHETTVNLIGNGALALLRHPDQLRRWQEDPSLAKGAVDEVLRYDSPVQMAMRVLLEPTELAGRLVPAGEQVLVLLGAANRDPAMFADPDRFDILRPEAARNMSFGGGIHHCLGMALARFEGQIALGALVERFPNLSLGAEPTLRDRFVLRGYETIPVTV